MTATVAGVILAAGAGSRYRASMAAGTHQVEPITGAGPDQAGTGGPHKLRALFRGRPVLSWVIDTVLEVGFNQVYLVTGAVPLDDLIPPGVTMVANPDWASGQSSSLRRAVEAAQADDHRAIVVGLGDQPLVPASAWRSVGAAAGAIVMASFDGQRQPPVKLDRSVWPELPASGDFGARTLAGNRPDLVSEIPCRGNPVDIDTVEDLRRWS
jgi:molybdenum cofactor cytidylyltransferase